MTEEELKYYKMARLIELLQIKLGRGNLDHTKIEANSETIRVGRYGYSLSGTGKTYPDAVFACADAIKKQAEELLKEINSIMETT
jgi:hypothetical protein